MEAGGEYLIVETPLAANQLLVTVQDLHSNHKKQTVFTIILVYPISLECVKIEALCKANMFSSVFLSDTTLKLIA